MLYYLLHNTLHDPCSSFSSLEHNELCLEPHNLIYLGLEGSFKIIISLHNYTANKVRTGSVCEGVSTAPLG